MGFKGAGLFHAGADEPLDIGDLAIFAMLGQIADRIFEMRPFGHEAFG